MTEASISVHELRKLLRDVTAAGKSVQRQVRRVMREQGSKVLSEARNNASWSSRIPGAMRMRASLTGDRPGVVISVDRTAAPHGRVYEGMVGRVFRHPVFEQTGRPVVWVGQDARPYLQPAVAGASDEVMRAIADAANRAMSEHNL